ncbi:MAG: pantoate--beta-alanine ligase, partial [Beijerinckiaceae bacterium]
ARAAVVPSVLRQAAENLRNGVTPARAMKNARSALEKAGFVVDYVEARDAGTLAPLTRGQRDNIRLLVAAKIGATRLIDNMAV